MVVVVASLPSCWAMLP